MQVVSFSRDVYHILQLDHFYKIPTSEMALKQQHKTDEMATNDMELG